LNGEDEEEEDEEEDGGAACASGGEGSCVGVVSIDCSARQVE